jgi:lysophospholipase L1-like esterase
MKLLQKLILVAASSFISLILVLSLGEIAFRLRTPASMRLQNNHILLPRNRTYIFRNTGLRGCDTRIVHHKNSLGFRGAEPPKDFQDALTVIAVGGSTTECFYLSDGHSWPEVVGHLKKNKIPKLWVNNAGFDGHSTFGHTILVREVLGSMHPDAVLFLVGVNDIGRDDLVKYDKDFLIESAPCWKKVLTWFSEKSRMIACMENLGRALNARQHGLNHHSLELQTQPSLAIPESKAQGLLTTHQTTYIPAYRKRLRQLIKLCQVANIRPIFITQPALYGKGRDPVTGIDLETIEVTKEENGRLAWQVLQAYNATTRAEAISAKVPVIDLANELPKTSDYFYDFYHFTNAGAEKTAEIVSARLLPILKNR